MGAPFRTSRFCRLQAREVLGRGISAAYFIQRTAESLSSRTLAVSAHKRNSYTSVPKPIRVPKVSNFGKIYLSPRFTKS